MAVLGRNAKQLDSMSEASRDVRAPAKAKEVNTVARPPDAEDRCVAADDPFGQTTAEHLIHVISKGVRLSRFRRTDPMNIKGDLLVRIHGRVRPGSRSTIKLVDICSALVGENTSLIPGPVHKHQDVFGHGLLPCIFAPSGASF